MAKHTLPGMPSITGRPGGKGYTKIVNLITIKEFPCPNLKIPEFWN